MSEGKVSCLTATHGRFNLMRRVLAMWLWQDYRNTELIIVNTAPKPIQCPIPGVRVYNEPQHSTLGAVRNRLLALAEGEFIRTWDDDDLYLPWSLRDGVAHMVSADASKPNRSWFWNIAEGRAELADNSMEATVTIRRDVARRYGYQETSGDEHAPLMAGIADRLRRYETGDASGYAYTWGSGVYHASGTLGSGTVQQRTADWLKANADYGPAGGILLPDFAAAGEAMARFSIAAHASALDAAVADSGIARLDDINAVYASAPWDSSASTRCLGAWLPMEIARRGVRRVATIGIGRAFLETMCSRALAADGRDAALACIDTDATATDAAFDAVVAARCSDHFTARCCNGDSANRTGAAWRQNLPGDGPILAVIDGDHSDRAVAVDLRNLAGAVGDGEAAFCCHDYSPNEPGVMAAVNAFLKERADWRLDFVLPEIGSEPNYATAILRHDAAPALVPARLRDEPPAKSEAAPAPQGVASDMTLAEALVALAIPGMEATAPAPANGAAVTLADCCGSGESARAEGGVYARVNGVWHLCGCLASTQDAKARTVTWTCHATPARFCQWCGLELREAPTRRYHAGRWPPFDDLIQRLVTEGIVRE